MTARCEDIDFDLKIAEFRINGYAVLEDVLSVDTVDRIREAFMPMLEHVKERETGIADKEWGDLRTGITVGFSNEVLSLTPSMSPPRFSFGELGALSKPQGFGEQIA